MVGTMTSGSPAGWATDFAVSIVFPPPIPTTASALPSEAAFVTRSISSGEHSPPNSTRVAPRNPSRVPPMSSSTIGSHSSRGLEEPNCSRTSPSLPTAPLPWMYLPGAANTAAIGLSLACIHTPPLSSLCYPHTTECWGHAQRTLHPEGRSGGSPGRGSYRRSSNRLIKCATYSCCEVAGIILSVLVAIWLAYTGRELAGGVRDSAGCGACNPEALCP